MSGASRNSCRISTAKLRGMCPHSVKGLACKARIVAQSDALFHHRSGSHAGPQGTRKGSEVELPRTPDDGESERTGGEHAGDHGLRFGRASCRAADGGTAARRWGAARWEPIKDTTSG